MTRILGSLISVAILSASAFGQTAKQGDASPEPIAFHSPMVLEAVFAPADRALWVSDDWTPKDPKPWKSGEFTTIEYYNFSKFPCDGLYLQREGQTAGVVVEHVRQIGAETKVKLEVSVTNPGPVHDKRVTLLLEVLNAGETVATSSTTIKLNQSFRESVESNSKYVTLLVPSSKVPGSRLRITMSTKDY
jgi:hypothetical protein